MLIFFFNSNWENYILKLCEKMQASSTFWFTKFAANKVLPPVFSNLYMENRGGAIYSTKS
jgi:hypothetical protein